MFIVYGTSTSKKILARSNQPITCNHCGTMDNWVIYRYRKWFTLFFFLKLFPVGGATYFYVCPKCKYGFEITSQNLNNILNQVMMTEKLSKEINKKSFKKALAKVDARIAKEQRNNQGA